MQIPVETQYEKTSLKCAFYVLIKETLVVISTTTWPTPSADVFPTLFSRSRKNFQTQLYLLFIQLLFYNKYINFTDHFRNSDNKRAGAVHFNVFFVIYKL